MKFVGRIGGLALPALVVGLACSNPVSVSVVALDIDGRVVVSPPESEEFRVTISNKGDERVVWGMGSSSCQLTLVAIDKNLRVFDHLENRGCTADLAEQGLDAGQERSEIFEWDGSYIEGGERVALPPGDYKLYGVAGEYRTSGLSVRIK